MNTYCLRPLHLFAQLIPTELFLANHQSALAGSRLTKGNPGEDLSQPLKPALDKLTGVTETHGDQSQIEKELNKRMAWYFMLHKQNHAIVIYRPFHLPQGFFTSLPL